MSRSEELAAAFERTNADLVACVRGLDAGQWTTPGVNSPVFRFGDEDEHRPVGAIAHHVASAYGRSAQAIGMVVAGQPITPPPGGGTTGQSVPDQAETIQLLEKDGARVAAVIRALTDEELDREAETFIGKVSVATFIERAINFHPYWHLTSIQATFEPAEKPT
jgi:DinB superfamily